MVRGAAARSLAAACGLAGDRIFGEPGLEPHPVALFGRAMRALERFIWRDSKPRGVLHATAGTVLGAAAGGLADRAARRAFGCCLPAAAGASYLAVAGRGLGEAARSVDAALGAGDLETARSLMPALVGRGTEELEEKEIVRAVVESVAENTVDAVVAPALWAAVGGAKGALAYRAVNTLDALVGHRDARYANFGSASARLDDLSGWVPARVTAGLVMLVRPRSASRVWRAVRHDARLHPSPNAGVAEAAFAAALGLRLGGQNRYGERVETRPFLGDGRPAERLDIERSVYLSGDVTSLLTALLAVTSAVAGLARGRAALLNRLSPGRREVSC